MKHPILALFSAALLLSFSGNSYAEVTNVGLLDTVLERYANVAATWATEVTNRASWLFWMLVTISMVWTFGFMALRKADLAEFFAEFLRFTIFTGFFWWLLLNGPDFAQSIINSLRQIGAVANGGDPDLLSPSSIVDVGFAIFDKVLDETSIWQPVDSTVGTLIAFVILVTLSLIGINMLLLLISGWVLAFAGIFYLGFGGSRWTSDIAINYFKTILGIAMQLFTMILIIGIGQSILELYYANMSGGVEFGEMGVMLIVAVTLLVLVNKLPPLVAGVITGASVGGQGIGQLGVGAAIGASGALAATAAMGSAMTAATAANAAGGAEAIMNAISKAQSNVAAGTDVLSRGSSGNQGGSSTGGFSSSGTSNSSGSALASAAGFSNGPDTSSVSEAISEAQSTAGLSSDISESESNGANGSAGSAMGHSPDTDSVIDAMTGAGGNTQSSEISDAADSTAQGSPKNSVRGAFKNAGKVAVDAAANLSQGIASVAQDGAKAKMEDFKDRVSETVGGKVATAIKGGDDLTEEELNEVSEFTDKT